MTTLKIETREQFESWLEKKQCENWRTEDQLMVPVDDVRTLYDAMRPRWLPCSERLPEVRQRVLFKIKWDDEPVIGWRTDTDWRTDNNNHAEFRGWDGCSVELRFENKNITDWMPLPELLPLPEES